MDMYRTTKERGKMAWINLFFLIATLGVNTMGAVGLINGLTQKQISDKYLTLITPSPATFGIWSVIYILLLISMIVMIAKKKDLYYQKAIDEITTLFRVSCILNLLWIVLFSYEMVEVSTFFILGFAIVLALIDRKLLEIHQGKRWLLPVTFGLYSGWLLIATVANIAAALVKQEWNGFGLTSEIWAIIMLIVAMALVGVVALTTRNAVIPLPVAWAYYGIHQFLTSNTGFQGQYPMLQNIALIGVIVLVFISVIQFGRNHFSVLPETE